MPKCTFNNTDGGCTAALIFIVSYFLFEEQVAFLVFSD